MCSHSSTPDQIVVHNAHQNNLQNLSLSIPLHTLTVVTGVSGSGKSSLAFDTIYAEGQRRYIETFSSYARQFLDRMDKPKVDSIEGIPPAIAIQQTNTVRTSRSTVGTMTEINDRLKLLFAKAADLYCPTCGSIVRASSPSSLADAALDPAGPFAGQRIEILFRIVPQTVSPENVCALLETQGYRHLSTLPDGSVEVIQDRLTATAARRARIVEAAETAFRNGSGHAFLRLPESAHEVEFSTTLSCCGKTFTPCDENLFSFNSAAGACGHCHGFGRIIGISKALVIPDTTLSVAEGCIKPFMTATNKPCNDYLVKVATKYHRHPHTPWKDLSEEDRTWYWEGDGSEDVWDGIHWSGVAGFFRWMESRQYKMHVRVLLSRYREYTECPVCHGTRLRPEATWWKVDFGEGEILDIHSFGLLPIGHALSLIRRLSASDRLDEAGKVALREVRPRLEYLVEVGLDYLSLDRQSRTLSGGETQRIALTTALGSALVNTLFVLDEPSIGLHPRDINRLNGVLARLRDAGNTLLIVEHDPDVIRSADRILELGPGPGYNGGKIVYHGPLAELRSCRHSATSDYLFGRKHVGSSIQRADPTSDASLTLVGAREHNLKNLTVDFPLNRLVSITGVSGSGKSTLINDILAPAILRAKGKATEDCGAFDALLGAEAIDSVVVVDQSPIGKSSRANPASYVGAFDAIRKLYARQPLAKERGFTETDFSYNASRGRGRCPSCAGTGYEIVEMQYLSDVILPCEDCHGARYKGEILDVQIHAPWGDTYSIADVLDLPVDDSLELFALNKDIVARLQPLADVGLGYLRLGQPLSTLSGGEAQRLKIADALAECNANSRSSAKPKLFLLDEPTTGLHFKDIDVLLRVLRILIMYGHSVIAIEHNLDFIAASDALIDLGPEGGDAGGQVVATGSPEAVASLDTHTGHALRRYYEEATRAKKKSHKAAPKTREATAPFAPSPVSQIDISGARQNNLKNLNVTLPLGAFNVITGVSGSGKSTLAFDLLFAEGQNRYLECLNAYARQFVQPAARPDVDSIRGLPPTVAIEQRLSRGGQRSTVATVSEVWSGLRLLFMTLGTQYCPDCGIPITCQHAEDIFSQIVHDFEETKITLYARLVAGRKGIYKDLAAECEKKGITHLRVDGKLLETAHWPALDRYREHTIDQPLGTLSLASSDGVIPCEEWEKLEMLVSHGLDIGKGVLRVAEFSPRPESDPSRDRVYSSVSACTQCGRSFEDLDPRSFSFNSHRGWCPECQGYGITGMHMQHAITIAEREDEAGRTQSLVHGDRAPSDDVTHETCPHCHGARLNDVSLAVRFQNRSIADFARLSVREAAAYFDSLSLSDREERIAHDILADLRSRLSFLARTGLEYLTLDRAVPTLSGGESQRIRLAAQLGSNLRGVCYILDEPTIGLHVRDNERLLDTLRGLRDHGNTVVVVEHDEETIRQADYIVDIGPGAGRSGGTVVAAGTLSDIAAVPESKTAQALAHPIAHPLHGHTRPVSLSGGKSSAITITNASLHNLRKVSTSIPLGRLVVVSGPSGSGKSTLVRDILAASIQNSTKGLVLAPVGCESIAFQKGSDPKAAAIPRRLLEVDQTPIGRTPRSCPATYVGFWGAIRELFAATPEARLRGWSASRFSFNVEGGRCPVCAGQGLIRSEMAFLPDVLSPCERCHGARFTEETLAIRYQGASIADVLAMSVDEARPFFAHHPAIRADLELLHDVGLGYLALGQQSSTLSGGEAQRIKLVTELAKCADRGVDQRIASTTLYLLDEPTVGLHMADIPPLLNVLHRLVDAGHSVMVIEHNMDVIAEADWLLDLGPSGGDDGGRLVAQGTPLSLSRKPPKKSATAAALASPLVTWK